jgi:hypothetical protein
MQALEKIVELALDGHAAPVHSFEPLKNPTQSWPLGRLLELIWSRRLLARQLVAAALCHGVDQPRQGHDHQQAFHPAGLFPTQR